MGWLCGVCACVYPLVVLFEKGGRGRSLATGSFVCQFILIYVSEKYYYGCAGYATCNCWLYPSALISVSLLILTGSGARTWPFYWQTEYDPVLPPVTVSTALEYMYHIIIESRLN